MATGATRTEVEPAGDITVTEVWPDRFELTVEPDCNGMAVETTYTLDRARLEALRQEVDEALR